MASPRVLDSSTRWPLRASVRVEPETESVQSGQGLAREALIESTGQYMKVRSLMRPLARNLEERSGWRDSAVVEGVALMRQKGVFSAERDALIESPLTMIEAEKSGICSGAPSLTASFEKENLMRCVSSNLTPARKSGRKSGAATMQEAGLPASSAAA